MNPPASLPEEPGCYLFRDGEGTILYVGKAKNLRKRVASYFQKKDQDRKTRILLSAFSDIDFIVTGSEVEALILENSLIKANQPRFNIDLKDAKQYAYIQLTDEPFPRLCIARQMTGGGSFFGPFVSAAARDEVLAFVKRMFRLRTCRKLTKRACLRAHLGSCSAPCRGTVTDQGYREQVRQATLVLKGETGELVRSLKEEMNDRSKTLDFEHALQIRNLIFALERLSERQDMARQKETDEDIVHYIVHSGQVYLMLFNVHRGMLLQKREYIFDHGEDFFEEFLVQYYSEHHPPSELILPVQVSESVTEFLSMRKGKKVTVTVPRIGSKKRLLSLVERNIEIAYFGDLIKMEELQEKLALEEPPRVIECFDISHISGTSVVGSMVQFRDGRPDKRNYRRFRIKTVGGIDDPAAIAEVVGRRYRRLVSEQGEIPSLVVVDGGRTQLQAAVRTLREVGVPIPVIALAKREERIYIPGSARPLPVKKGEKASLLLQEIRDEAHRFAVTYHRLVRKKKVIP